jgi:hypothetical protein
MVIVRLGEARVHVLCFSKRNLEWMRCDDVGCSVITGAPAFNLGVLGRRRVPTGRGDAGDAFLLV